MFQKIKCSNFDLLPYKGTKRSSRFADRSYRQTRVAHLLLAMSTGHYSVSLNRFMKLRSLNSANANLFSNKITLKRV